MAELGAPRLLVASLHAAIADVLPTRLGFYEHWLTAGGLRQGTIGAAPVQAVLSFLRREGASYEAVMTRAGECAAEWMVAVMPSVQRRALSAAPDWLRRRLLVRVARRLIRLSSPGSRTASSLRRGTARIDVRSSVFCGVREPVSYPLCVFYRPAFTRLTDTFGLSARVQVVACRGTGESSCVFELWPADAGGQAGADVEAA